MGPIWGRQDPDGPHVGPMNFVFWAGKIQKDFPFCGWLVSCVLLPEHTTLNFAVWGVLKDKFIIIWQSLLEKLEMNLTVNLLQILIIVQFDIIFLWSDDSIRLHRSYSTLAQVMAWWLTASNHYLNQCWFITKGVLWHSPESNFPASVQLLFCRMSLETTPFKPLPQLPEANELTIPGNAWLRQIIPPLKSAASLPPFLEMLAGRLPPIHLLRWSLPVERPELISGVSHRDRL